MHLNIIEIEFEACFTTLQLKQICTFVLLCQDTGRLWAFRPGTQTLHPNLLWFELDVDLEMASNTNLNLNLNKNFLQTFDWWTWIDLTWTLTLSTRWTWHWTAPRTSILLQVDLIPKNFLQCLCWWTWFSWTFSCTGGLEIELSWTLTQTLWLVDTTLNCWPRTLSRCLFLVDLTLNWIQELLPLEGGLEIELAWTLSWLFRWTCCGGVQYLLNLLKLFWTGVSTWLWAFRPNTWDAFNPLKTDSDLTMKKKKV